MKTIVITGATSGFGTQWLYDLDKFNSNQTLIVLARNPGKFAQLIRVRPLINKVHVIKCDLLSLNNIRTASEQIAKLTDQVDILVNNAGLWPSNSLTLSEDGIESSVAVNHIAPFLLTGLLLPLLKNSPQGRVVNTASFRHKDAIIDQDDFELRTKYSSELAYCNTKLCNILFTQYLARKIKNTSITVNCFDPGIVDTPMLKKAFPSKLAFLFPIARPLISRSPSKGAETGVYLCTSPEVAEQSGLYYKDKKIKPTSIDAQDNNLAKWLWQQSTALSQFEYSF